MEDTYEQGYQDGQMDFEEELLDDLRTSSNISLTVENRLGWETAVITITTTSDTRLYNMLVNLGRKTTESVVHQEPNVPKSHINGTFPKVSAPKRSGISAHLVAFDEIAPLSPKTQGLLEPQNSATASLS